MIPRVTDGAAARLKDDIDRGRTGDKVDWPDPSAAPLGTDDEAGGSPTASSVIEDIRRSESARFKPPPRIKGLGAAWILIGFVATAMGAILLAPQFVTG